MAKWFDKAAVSFSSSFFSPHSLRSTTTKHRGLRVALVILGSIRISCPTTNGGMQNVSSVGVCTYTMHTRFCMFGTKLYAQSVLINKISASELSRKFVMSALLVGCVSLFSVRDFTVLLHTRVRATREPFPSCSCSFYLLWRK